MTQNLSYDEFHRKPWGKLDQNQSQVIQSSSNRMKQSSSSLDNHCDFLLSRTLVATKYNILHNVSQEAEISYETGSNQVLKLPPIKKKPQLSPEVEFEDFIPHEIDIPPAESASSLSSTPRALSEYSGYALPIYQNLQSDIEKKQQIIESGWGRGTTLDIGFWEDSNAPVIKIRRKEDVALDITEAYGILSDEMVGACSSFISKSPQIGLYVQNKCLLMSMNLRDISVLYNHRYLQYIDLTMNNISDLTPLGGIPHLIYLNAAQNRLKDVLRFTPPWYLTYVNLALNKISEIDDLSEFWSIVRLDLSHNAIESIQGLQNLRHLRFLNLGYNLIECVENLDNLNIQELNLEYNCITDFKSATPDCGISTLPNLRTLILRHNKLSTLAFFEGAYGLRYIDLQHNKIDDLLEVSHLRSLVYEVDFRGNPCTEWSSYRDVLLFSMPSVMFVDGAEVTTAEKVSASAIFAPPMKLTAARSVTKLMLLEHLNPPNIDMHITPIDQSTPPLIILSGPPAVKKSLLARQIADSLPKRVRYCASHTTKDHVKDSSGRLSYHFVSREEFNEITRRGEFLSTEELLGNSYGFHISEISALVLEKKIGITHMDLNAALQMQGRYVNAKLILVLTKSVESHRQWIQEKFEVVTWVKNSDQKLVSIKAGRHGQSVIDIKESKESKLDFVREIVNEVIGTLEFPLFDINTRLQLMEETPGHLIIESPTILPTIVNTSSEIEVEKKHISFRQEEELTSIRLSKGTITPEKSVMPASVGLKIIFDEQSNVVVENEVEKRERQKARILLRNRSVQQLQMNEDQFVEGDEFGDSPSSEDTFVPKLRVHHMDSPRALEGLYSKLVIQSRDLYLQQHLEIPGFFSLVVFTDEFVSAFNQVVDFIYEFYIHQPLRKPMFSAESQKVLETVIPSKSKVFLKELQEYVEKSIDIQWSSIIARRNLQTATAERNTPLYNLPANKAVQSYV